MERLKRWLIANGISQAAFARSLGINPATVSHYVLGRREPDIGTLKKMSRLTELTIDDLVGNAPRKKRRSPSIQHSPEA